jgi:hypothetical protein
MNFVLFFLVTAFCRSLASLSTPVPSLSSLHPISIHGSSFSPQLPLSSSSSSIIRSTSIGRTKESSRGTTLHQEVDVLVVGGGLCGSTASFYLNQSDVKILLIEEKESLGGCINSRQGPACLLSISLFLSLCLLSRSLSSTVR